MKRIAQNVAVTTLLYTMKPDARVRIVDVDHNIFMYTRDQNWEAQEGLGEVFTVDQILHNVYNTRIANARIRATGIYDDMLILVIDTEDEEY